MGKNVSLTIDFQLYKEEIRLIQTQNRVECDLYSIIAFIIRGSKEGCNISLRDITTRRTSNFSKSFKGYGGFADFVIRTREESENASILGAVEVKYINSNLDSQKNIEQLNGHIEFYKNVIYTNGLEWRFYKLNKYRSKELAWPPICLGNFNNGEIIWNEEKKWDELLERLDKITWIKQK